MTNDELLRRSAEAGEFPRSRRVVSLDTALLAIAQEREACAKLCESPEPFRVARGVGHPLAIVAKAIRARSKGE